MDYLRYWSLRHSPFHTGGRSRFLAAAYRSAAARVHFLVGQGVSLAALISSRGVGTTTLLHHLADTRGVGDCATEFIVSASRQTRTDRAIDVFAASLGICVDRNSEANVSAAINASAARSIRTVWLIDESGGVDPRQARILANRFCALTVILTVGIRDADRLAIPKRQRVNLRNFSREETEQFIEQSLRIAGCAGRPFSKASVDRIHQLSGGKVKAICQIAERLLAHAAADGLRQITEADVRPSYSRAA
jgi:type II secretory pathway predicted ATPase ExeA